MDSIVVELGPDRVQRIQPGKQLVILRHHTSEVLIHVVVGVDHAGHHHVAAQIVCLRDGDIRFVGAGANPEDGGAVDQDGTIADLAALIVKGGEVIDMVE